MGERDAGRKFVRGNRKRLLALAVEPLQGKLPSDSLQRVIHAFSLIYGSEVFLVLKDIWGLELDNIQDVTQWMAKAILRQAEEDAMNSKNISRIIQFCRWLSENPA